MLCVRFLNCSVITAMEIGWGLLWMYGTELRVTHKPGFVLSCTVIDERIKTRASNNEFPVWILRGSVCSVLQSYFISFLNNSSACCLIGSFVRLHESLELSRMRFDSPVEHTHTHTHFPPPQQAGHHRNFFSSFCFDEIYLESKIHGWVDKRLC